MDNGTIRNLDYVSKIVEWKSDQLNGAYGESRVVMLKCFILGFPVADGFHQFTILLKHALGVFSPSIML